MGFLVLLGGSKMFAGNAPREESAAHRGGFPHASFFHRVLSPRQPQEIGADLAMGVVAETLNLPVELTGRCSVHSGTFCANSQGSVELLPVRPRASTRIPSRQKCCFRDLLDSPVNRFSQQRKGASTSNAVYRSWRFLGGCFLHGTSFLQNDPFLYNYAFRLFASGLAG